MTRLNHTHAIWNLLLALLLLGGCSAPVSPVTPTSIPRAERPAFKGMELYSWPDEKGQWAFSLLPGTNRNKTVEEVREQPLSLAGVKEGISRLAVGEQVLWITRVYDSSGGWVAFPLPPADVVQELKQFASSNQVILQ